MTEKIPSRKLPEINISKERAEDLKTISAMTKILADDADLTKKIADEFLRSTQVDPKDRVVAQVELKERVTKLVADKLKSIPADKIATLFPYWYPIIVQYWIPRYWIPYQVYLWEPYSGQM